MRTLNVVAVHRCSTRRVRRHLVPSAGGTNVSRFMVTGISGIGLDKQWLPLASALVDSLEIIASQLGFASWKNWIRIFIVFHIVSKIEQKKSFVVEFRNQFHQRTLFTTNISGRLDSYQQPWKTRSEPVKLKRWYRQVSPLANSVSLLPFHLTFKATAYPLLLPSWMNEWGRNCLVEWHAVALLLQSPSSLIG